MPQTVEVRFKGIRRDFYLWPEDDEPLRLKEAVIVEVDRGQDLGRVHTSGDAAEKKCASACAGCAVGSDAPDKTDKADEADKADGAEKTEKTDAAPPATLRKVLRRATQEEIRTANELRVGEEDARRKVIDKVRQHALDMKVSDAEWQWDRNKLTVYFTAEKRVDFRALVRDLAGVFRTRIELRQIGVRDEAARLTGVGRCGREYCCSTWLKELSPVSLALAKDQHLSLNPAQISGGCGRLLCCLKYEHEFYVASRKRFPREGKMLETSLGSERVIAVDIFRERVFLRSEEQGPRIIPLAQLKEEMEQAGVAVADKVAVAVRADKSDVADRRTGGPADRTRREGRSNRADRGTGGQADKRSDGHGQTDRANQGLEPPVAPPPPAAESIAPPTESASPDAADRPRRRRRRGRRGRGPGPTPPSES